MAGMFYSLKETAERLGKTEVDVKEMAKQGQLRTFRDGAHVMFKIDEVEALAGPAPAQSAEPEEVAPIDEDASLEQGEIDSLLEPIIDEQTELPMTDKEFQEEEPLKMAGDEQGPAKTDEDIEILLGMSELDSASPEKPSEPAPGSPEDDLFLVDDLHEATDAPAKPDQGEDLSDTQVVSAEAKSEEDLLAASTGQEELTGLDTALTGEGLSVLSESDGDFKLTDDTLAETTAGLGAGEGSALEKLEEDVTLDSFGSGSGLLDLSLQADDTSLGGVLDEIYTPEGEGGGAAQDSTQPASVEDVAAEADHIPVEAGAEMVGGPVMAAAVVETQADESSNWFGGILFIPIAVYIYTVIAALGGQAGFVPGIVSPIAPMIWMVMGGILVVAMLLVAVAFSKGGGPRPPKAPKPKKEKKAKGKKESAE